MEVLLSLGIVALSIVACFLGPLSGCTLVGFAQVYTGFESSHSGKFGPNVRCSRRGSPSCEGMRSGSSATNCTKSGYSRGALILTCTDEYT